MAMIYWNEYEKYAGSTGGMGEYIQPEDSTRFSTNREPKEIYPLVTSANNNPQSEGPRVKAKKEKKKTGYGTKKVFAIGMICAMLATSGLTIGGLGLAGAFDRTVPGDTKVRNRCNE